jgi:hypothetical protein
MKAVLLAIAIIVCASMVGTARCAVRAASSGATNVVGLSAVQHREIPPALRAVTAQRAVPTTIGNLKSPIWFAALSRMPLDANVTKLDRTNCIPVILNAFQSNDVVKALIFMPGATDELYFFRRAHATLPGANSTLADAIVALTSQSYIRADFRPPFLILHTTEDSIDPIAIIRNKTTAAKLQERILPDRLVFNDCPWDNLRAALKKKLSVGIRPFSNAPDSWHFYRHNFAACGVTQWQLLEAIGMAGQTTFTVHWLTADFELDMRTGPTPGF